MSRRVWKLRRKRRARERSLMKPPTPPPVRPGISYVADAEGKLRVLMPNGDVFERCQFERVVAELRWHWPMEATYLRHGGDPRTLLAGRQPEVAAVAARLVRS